jgi:endonuclease/exonuclease/phosphatase family metal-dependent hydrolase
MGGGLPQALKKIASLLLVDSCHSSNKRLVQAVQITRRWRAAGQEATMNHEGASLRALQGLKVLRQRIEKAGIPSSKLDETLNIATWNIREFGKKARTPEAIHYIAEILGQFDLISVVELRDDLTDLSRVLTILGPYWRAIYSDFIPDSGGNYERIAFVYDKRAVTFTGLADGAVPDRTKTDDRYDINNMWWRTPYLGSFRAGNFDFVIMTAHIRWGKQPEERLKEVQSVADWLKAKFQQKHLVDVDWLVTGDFNIGTQKMYEALLSAGLQAPDSLRQTSFGTTLSKDKRYDQILHRPLYTTGFSLSGGFLDFYDGDFSPLFDNMNTDSATFQLSDHFPLWVQISTDIAGQKIDQLITAKDQG